MSTPPTEPSDSAVRTRLLQAALTLFASRGYASTTVREIVEAAGVSKPVLYYYFGSKEGLYQTLLDESFADFGRLIAAFAATPGPARQRLVDYCAAIYASAAANVEIVRLSHAIYYGPPQGAPFFDFESFFRKMIDGIAAILDAGVASGEFRPLPRHELSWGVMGILNLALQDRICRDTPRFNGDHLRVALNILLDGIAAGESQ